MPKKKKKLSAYQKHVRKEMKAGKTMKQAAKSWKSTSKSTKTPKKRRKTMAKKKKSRKRGARILGNVGIKGALTGGAMLFATQALLPAVGGDFSPAVQKVIAGIGSKAVGVSGAALAGAGAMEAGAILISRLLGGGIPQIGGISSGNNGGYML